MLRFVTAAFAALLLLAMAPGDGFRSFDGATGWIGSAPLTADDLRGKVVLVDFWEYTCINCLRTLPYLREWYKRYHDDGFVIVGVHTPEFGFSGAPPNVGAAMKNLGITWPVAIDSNYAIWKRYGINEWPTELLFDQDGKLVEQRLGEGDYQHTESQIQALLLKTHPGLTMPKVMALLPQDSYNKPGAVCYPQTPELLVDARPVANAPHFGDPSQDLNYRDDGGQRQDGSIYLSGYWHTTKQAVVFGGGGGYFALPYHAIQVAVVMTPEGPTRVNVLQDGKPVAREDAGADLRYDGNGMSYVNVDAPRSYDLLMNKTFGEHELRLMPQGHGLGIYDVAFESCEVPQGASH